MKAECGLPGQPRVNSLKLLLDERWSECLNACAQAGPGEERHDTQLKLYAAMKRLSEAVENETVPEAILEIGANLLACEQMAVLVLPIEEKSGPSVHSVGLSQKRIESLHRNAKRIVSAVPEGRFYAKGGVEPDSPFLASLGITAHVPLWQNSKMRGAIVLYDLLPQKQGFSVSDHALLKLLAVYAGPCLFNS